MRIILNLSIWARPSSVFQASSKLGLQIIIDRIAMFTGVEVMLVVQDDN